MQFEFNNPANFNDPSGLMTMGVSGGGLLGSILGLAFNLLGWNAINNVIGSSSSVIRPPDEFDRYGNRISNLGGNQIDFYHQADGNTKIIDRVTGAFNVINGGEALIRNYALRNNSISWLDITEEFLTNTGPVNSLFADFNNSNEGSFGSLHDAFSSYSSLARENALNSKELKNTIKMNYENANPLMAKDMWEQMWGRSNISWYKLGDKTLFMMNDAKSATSLYYRLSGNWERKSSRKFMGNTRQTYLWLETNKDIQQKVDKYNIYWHNEFQKILAESRRSLPGKI